MEDWAYLTAFMIVNTADFCELCIVCMNSINFYLLCLTVDYVL